MLGKYARTSSLLGNRVYDAQSYGFQTPKKSNQVTNRVARWYLFKPKITIWVNFGGLGTEKVGIFYVQLDFFMATLHV
jgi:hypothetical protein